MPIQPILKICKKPTIHLDPQALIARREPATWVAQCIANWSWVEHAIGSLFINLLGTNLTAGAALYSDMTSALAKDKALRSVALSTLEKGEYEILEALLKYKDSHQRTRDKFAHWYWGTCAEITDGLILVDPRYLMQYRANILSLFEKNQLRGAQIDQSKIYVARVKDLKTDAKDFSNLAVLVFSFANLVVEKNQAKRAQRFLALSTDDRIRIILDGNRRSATRKTRPTPPLQLRKSGRKSPPA